MLLSMTIMCMFCLVNPVFFPNMYPRLKLDPKQSKDVGEPLILTPYLKKNMIYLAQNLSRVTITDELKIPSYAGFFTINKKYNSNLYFWYFPPFSKNNTEPVLLWLQGGPGGSSLFGLFTEIGPLVAKKDKFVLRRHHWALQYHIIFIDNPVGTGFSFTESTAGYCACEDCIAKGLYKALKQFFKLFPDLKRNDFYITGESYAGKYITSLAMLIHKEPKCAINLKGLAMGNAYCDPINQLDYGNYLFQHGLLDRNQLEIFLKYQIDIYLLIKNESWLQANMLLDRLMDGQVTHFSLFNYYTGYNYYYDYLQTAPHNDLTAFLMFVNEDYVRRSIHVGGLSFQDGETVQLLLAMDLMKSVASKIAELLSHYKIMFYNGQLDIIVAYPLTENFLRNLKFSASEEYERANRYIWKVDKEIAGYVKHAGNLTEVLVRNAGHMVPKDQPKWTLDLITRFINNKL